MANRMLLHLGLSHRGVPDRPLLVDCSTAQRLLLMGCCPHGMPHGPLLTNGGMAHGPLLTNGGMVYGPLLTDGGFGRIRTSGGHHRRTMVPLRPNRSGKGTAH